MPASSDVIGFSPLSAEAMVELASARGFISSVASSLLDGGNLTQSAEDLAVLQAVASHEAMRNANYEAWVALGISFGDALVAYIPGLVWRLVTEKGDTYVALQFRQKSISIAAPTMLWKRVERGEELDLEHIARELKTLLAEHADEVEDA